MHHISFNSNGKLDNNMEEIEVKSPFQWCLENKIRVLDLNQWPLTLKGSKEEHYFKGNVDKEDFLEALSKCTVKANSTPRKTDKYLEYRMYGLVPYNLSPIQQGIQFGHAVVEYQLNTINLKGIEDKYAKWAREDKTFIILNGGTTNRNITKLGTLNKHHDTLKNNGVLTAEFYEPDLGDQLTAVVFLVDERVFNRELYPDFVGTPYPWSAYVNPTDEQYAKWEKENNKNYEGWLEKIGGPTNAFLRSFLPQFRLA
jgi:hypothetical protein